MSVPGKYSIDQHAFMSSRSTRKTFHHNYLRLNSILFDSDEDLASKVPGLTTMSSTEPADVPKDVDQQFGEDSLVIVGEGLLKMSQEEIELALQAELTQQSLLEAVKNKQIQINKLLALRAHSVAMRNKLKAEKELEQQLLDRKSDCSGSLQQESSSSGLVQTSAKTVTTSGKTKRTSSCCYNDKHLLK